MRRQTPSCLVAGFDPDTTGSAVAIVTTRRVVAIGVNLTEGKTGMLAVKAQRKALRPFLRRACSIGELDRVAVEIPMDYGQKRFVDPNGLMRLSLISGAAGSIFDEFSERVDFLEPFRWKGQRPKPVDQANTLRYFGWEFEQPTIHSLPRIKEPPDDVVLLSEIPASSWVDVIDAMGLGLYALQKEGAHGVR